jgi:IclR family acetate operon transcriptional repressor
MPAAKPTSRSSSRVDVVVRQAHDAGRVLQSAVPPGEDKGTSRPDREGEQTRGGRANYHIAALGRGLGVLRALAEARAALGLSELEHRTAIPKSTLVRLLTFLIDAGFVVRVDEIPTFWLGPAIMPVAEAYAAALDMSSQARPTLAALATSTGQTANLAVLDGVDVVHLCVVEPDRPIRFRSTTGSRDGAHQTGLGKVLLAFCPPESLGEHLPQQPYAARTSRTITNRRALLAELSKARRDGFAFDDEEGDVGVRCLAAPIRSSSQVVAALSVSGPAAELAPPDHESLLRQLRQAVLDLENRPQFHHALQIARRAIH